MDVKESINKIVDKVKKDKNFQAKLTKDPVGAVEEVLGVKLPKEQVDKIVAGVKANVTADKAKDALENVGGKISGVFKK